MSTVYRLVKGGLLALLLGVLLYGSPSKTLAQNSTEITTRQSISATYGKSITLSLEATSPIPITAAQLAVQIVSRGEVYVKDVPVNAGMTIALTHTLSPQEIDLPPFAVLIYAWNLTDEAGNQHQTDPQQARYEDTSVPWQWVVTSHENVFIHTDGNKPEIGDAALSISTDALREAGRLTGVTIIDDVHIYVYPELPQMANGLRLHNRQVQDWVAAYAIPDQRTAIVAASSGPELYTNLERDISHEITHLVIGYGGGEHAESIPGWFNEGLALMNAPEPDPTLYQTLYDAGIENQRPLHALETLCITNFSSLPPQEAALAYAQSESVMHYVSDQYGTSSIRALMAAYTEGKSCDAGVQSALGITLDSLDRQWRNHLTRTLRQSPEQSNSLIPWVITWALSVVLALLFIAPQPTRPTGLSGYDTQHSLPPIPDDISA